MPEQTYISPDDVRYRLVATTTSTLATDTTTNEMKTRADSIEVIVSDSRMVSRGSQFGHVAIIVDGVAYSRSHDGYDSRKTYAQYVATQRSFRDSVGYVLAVSPDEKKKIETELKRRVALSNGVSGKPGYSLLDNSCSSNVADVLNLVGIVAYDPRWSALGIVSPQDVAVGLSHSKRVKVRRLYPRDSS